MLDVTHHPISNRWPAQDPSVLQLYSFPTPNGVKVSIVLEEMEIPTRRTGSHFRTRM